MLENNVISRRCFQLGFLFRSLPTLWRLNEKIYFVSDLSPKRITYIVHWLSKTHDLYSYYYYYYFSPSINTKRRKILQLPFLFLWPPVKVVDYIRVRTDMCMFEMTGTDRKLACLQMSLCFANTEVKKIHFLKPKGTKDQHCHHSFKAQTLN